MKRFFDSGLYVRTLGSTQLTGILCMIAGGMAGVLPALSQWLVALYSGADSIADKTVDSFEFYEYMGVIALLAPVVVLHAFSFLTSAPRTDLFFSLPLKRGCLFRTVFAAALTWIFGSFLLSTGLSAVLWRALPACSLNGTDIALGMLPCLCNLLWFSGAAAAAACVTGATLSTAITCVSVISAPSAIVFGLSAEYILIALAFGGIKGIGTLLWLFLNLKYTGVPLAMISLSPGVLWYVLSAVIALLPSGLAGILFVRRRGECTGRPFAGNKTSMLIRCLTSLPLAAAAAGLTVWNSYLYAPATILLAVSAALWLAFDVMERSRVKAALRRLPIFVVFVIVVYVLSRYLSGWYFLF